MKKKNGFTLVELLAVIVILALVMVLTIPSIINVMSQARRKTFQEYISKFYTAAVSQYESDSGILGTIKGAGWYVYDVENDIGLADTGNYKGFIVVNASNVDEPHFIIELYNDNYMINNYDITNHKIPDADSTYIKPYSAGTVKTNAYDVCVQAMGGAGHTCYSRTGFPYLAP